MAAYSTYQIPKVIDPITYSKPPKPPTGEAAWLSSTISQPYFPQIDINPYLVGPVNVCTYFKPPAYIYVTNSNIGQPVATTASLIPNVFQTSTYSRAPPAPQGAASWLSRSISQPYIQQYDINQINLNPNAGNLRTLAVLPPIGIATWLSKSISQPLFIPYDVNAYVYPASIGTYYKAPPAPKGVASYLTNSISQPYFAPYDVNTYCIPPVNISTYFKAVNLMETLQDDFEFGGVDSGKWSNYGGSQVAATTNLLLELTSSLGGNYVGILSNSIFNLTGSYAFTQLVDAGNQSITSLEVYPIQLSHGNDALAIMVAGNTVYARKKLSGSTTTVGSSVAYNASIMKWFRIRESGGTTYWEYATDPTGVWTQIASATNPIPVTALNGEILIGTWQAESSTTTAKVDNFNVVPGSLQFSWQGNVWNRRIHQGSPVSNQTWSPNNVGSPDGNNYLTISITNPSGVAPLLAEFFSARRGFGYGTYTTVIATELDNIGHPSSFGGMFTFDFTAPPDYKEIDVNETRDYNGNPNKRILKSHVYNNGGSRTFITDDMDVPPDVVQTHRMIWTPAGITFDSFIGQGTSGTNYFHAVHTTNLPTPGLERVHFNIWVDPNISGYLNVPRLDVIIRSFDFEPLGYSAWVSNTISRPYFTPYDANTYGIPPVNVGTYYKAPPAPKGSASWLSATISQPYFTPYDVNQIVWNQPAGNLKAIAPPPPVGVATWLSSTINQPFFTPYDVNAYVYPAPVATYSKPPAAIFVTSSTISQPVGSLPYPIPQVQYPLKTLTIAISPAWFTNTISQPIFTIPQTPVYPADIATYKAPPPAPIGSASWLKNSISQPYFAPYDVNTLVWTPNAGNLRTLVITPLGYASWVSRTISQPFFTPYDVNNLVYPANVSTYKSALPAPTGIGSWITKTVSQPYFTPYDVNEYVWPPSVVIYFKSVPPPTYEAEWLPTLIEQPYFTPYDVNALIWPANPITYSKRPTPPNGIASWLAQSISQPYILPYNELLYGIPPVNVGTYSKPPPPPVGEADWLPTAIKQPYFTPYDVNILVWPASPATYSKAPAAPVGSASYLAKSISQPFFTPYDINSYVWNPNAGNLRTVAPKGYVTWATLSISQPRFTPYDVNGLVWTINIGDLPIPTPQRSKGTVLRVGRSATLLAQSMNNTVLPNKRARTFLRNGKRLSVLHNRKR